MKYMHFNSSCSYAGLANMLALRGHDTEDVRIALEMGLPYFLRHDGATGYYQAGASLQSAEWFDLYLTRYGFRYAEEFLPRREVPGALKRGSMVGLRLRPPSRHAVICLETREGRYTFLNNQREGSGEPEEILLTEAELLEKLPDTAAVGRLEQCAPVQPDLLPYYREALDTWERLRGELHRLIEYPQGSDALRQAMDPFFRPLLLDGLAMAELIPHKELAGLLAGIQTEFLSALREGGTVPLSGRVSGERIDAAVDGFTALIRARLGDA